jgi:hypothetical protein
MAEAWLHATPPDRNIRCFFSFQVQGERSASFRVTLRPGRAPMEDDRNEKIRTRAHQIWESEGRKEGSHEAHWQRAEREVTEEERSRAGGSDDHAGSGQLVGSDDGSDPGGRGAPEAPEAEAKADRRKL